MCELARETKRQIGLLIDRAGAVSHVVIGDHQSLLLPDLSRFRGSHLRLRGLRLVHTHLNDEPISTDDLSDLAMLRLDLLAAVSVAPDGLPGRIRLAHLNPGDKESNIEFLEAAHPALLDLNCLALIQALEEELTRKQGGLSVDDGRDRALLVSVGDEPAWMADQSLTELKDLAESAGVEVLGSFRQRVKKVNPTFFIGRGKMMDLSIEALQRGANLLIIDQDLSPSQNRNLGRTTELRIIDRTQLILDIFAQRALSREGKLQVEKAQLGYRLPYLGERDNALSRLTGGIGGRGPGETRLEIDRRRVRDRLTRLTRDLKKIGLQRFNRRGRRDKMGLPIVSIVGYTNAGKSTLLNTLTRSDILAEDRLFATLDPTTRRLKLPQDQEIIITDTVGFIHRLPPQLVDAFHATLEELSEADLLLHLVDASSPDIDERIATVNQILADLDLRDRPTIQVFNKMDLIDEPTREIIAQRYGGIMISARRSETLIALVEFLQAELARLADGGR